jgi:hypothetical protein
MYGLLEKSMGNNGDTRVSWHSRLDILFHFLFDFPWIYIAYSEVFWEAGLFWVKFRVRAWSISGIFPAQGLVYFRYISGPGPGLFPVYFRPRAWSISGKNPEVKIRIRPRSILGKSG